MAVSLAVALAVALDFQVALAEEILATDLAVLDFLAAEVLDLALAVALGEVSETALVLYLECSFEYLANMDLVLDPL